VHQLRSLGAKTNAGAPSREEVIRVFTASAIPFVGFGFLDNLIMVRIPVSALPHPLKRSEFAILQFSSRRSCGGCSCRWWAV
jgi:hypothetical protein